MAEAYLSTNCPICDEQLKILETVEVMEIITCPSCQSNLVVVSKQKDQIALQEAPVVEEDWGE